MLVETAILGFPPSSLVFRTLVAAVNTEISSSPFCAFPFTETLIVEVALSEKVEVDVEDEGVTGEVVLLDDDDGEETTSDESGIDDG